MNTLDAVILSAVILLGAFGGTLIFAGMVIFQQREDLRESKVKGLWFLDALYGGPLAGLVGFLKHWREEKQACLFIILGAGFGVTAALLWVLKFN